MRYLPTPEGRTAGAEFLLCAALVVGMTIATAACSGGDGGGPSADVSIDRISPQPTYAGVETTIEFSIDPGSDLSESDLEWQVDLGDGTTKSGNGTSGPVQHDWKQSGSYSLEVAARFEGSTIGSADRKLNVLAPVDLAVGNIQGRPTIVQGGEQLSVQFDVQNKSASPIKVPFEVYIYLLPKDKSSISAEELANLESTDSGVVGENEDVIIEADSQRRVGISITIPNDLDSGEYRMVPWIRPEGQLADENPDDNFAVSSGPSGIIRVSNAGGLLPDVDVDNVFVIPDRAYPALNEFQRGFTLANKGDIDASGVTTKTYLSVGDKEIDDDDIEVGSSDETYDIPADSSVDLGPDQFVLAQDITPDNGEKKVYVIVEAALENEGDEATKDNNVAVSDPPITVTDERADGPDVVVDSFSVSPNITYIGGSLDVSLEVSNQGNTDLSDTNSATFTCRLYLGATARVDISNDDFFDTVVISGLASGESKTVSRTADITEVEASPGKYHAYVYCDPSGSIANETFRGNNARLHPDVVEVTSEPNVDLQIASVDVPKTVQDETDATITTEVCVTGKHASGNTRAELYETVGQQVDFSKDPKTTFEVPNITPGNCQKVDVTFKANCENFEETYSYGVRVDSDDDLKENKEMNNQATGDNTMEIQGQYCSCTEDQYEENDRARTSATFLSGGMKSGAVCTAGECDYYDIARSKNDSLRVETTYPADKGSLETTMYDPSGLTVLDKDTTPGRQRVATFSVSTSDNYVFSVCGANSASRNLYDMNVDVLSQPSGVDLIPRKVELPNQQTYSIGAEVSTDLRIHNIGDTQSGSFEVEFVITPDRTLGNGNDVPTQPSTVSVGQINPASRADLSKKLKIPPSLNKGDYYIAAEVDPTGQVSETDASNNTSFSKEITVQTRCYDPLEPNDSFSEAEKVQSRSYSNLTACASEDDYYRLCPKDGKKFDVENTYNPQKGDVDLELYDRNQQLIDSSATTGQGKEKVSVSYVNGAQCYFIRPLLLTQQSQASTTYDMAINVSNVSPSLQCDSHFEPNDSFQSSTSLINALQQSNSGTIDRCPKSDDDYYRLKLSKNQTVTLSGSISPSSQPGTLRLQLYNPNQQPTKNVETAPGVSTVKIKNYQAPTTGTYYLQVTLTGSQRNITYKLGAQGLGGIDLQSHNVFFVSKTYSGGESFNLQFDATNLRSATAKTPSYTIYLGDSTTLDRQNDTKLVSSTLSQDISGNSTVTPWEQVTLPQSVSSGTGYIHVELKPDASQTDPNSSNDVGTRSISLQ